jgi:predicted AAA+ superfamily ATPase
MDDKILSYVQRQYATTTHRLQNNVQSTTGNRYPQRHYYVKLDQAVSDFRMGKTETRWVTLAGLRGVGKTTVASQVFLSLRQKAPDLPILYVAMDEVVDYFGSNLYEVLTAYRHILGTEYENLEKPAFLLVDEVQKDPKWASALKSVFDKSKKLFVCATGSSMLSLQAPSDITRRTQFDRLQPMSLVEYQMMKNQIFPLNDLKKNVRRALYESSSAAQVKKSLDDLSTSVQDYWGKLNQGPDLVFNEYLENGTLPFLINESSQEQKFTMLRRMIDDVIYKDILAFHDFDKDTLRSINNLLLSLAETLETLSLNELHTTVGIAVNTVHIILDLLTRSGLLIRVRPYGATKGQIKKPCKYRFSSPAYRMALLGLSGDPKVLKTNHGACSEDMVALYLENAWGQSNRGDVCFDPEKGGADFVVQVGNAKRIVIEVKKGSKVGEGIDQTQRTLEKVKGAYGIVLSSRPNVEVAEKTPNIVLVPMTHFLVG